MKSINKILFAAFFIIITLINHSFVFAETETAVDLDKVMKTMLAVTLIIIAVVIWLFVVYSEKNDNEGILFKTPFKVFKQYITKMSPIEKESEMLLHHKYDGIEELDNRIPPWFNFLFYGTIIWGIIYMLVFHVFDDGQVQSKEYEAEMNQAAVERQILVKTGAFLNEETVTALSDAAVLLEGKEIFIKNCASCHGQNGEGTVGSNLTDDFWIHGGGIKNIFTVVKYGVPAKGMISWQTQLAPRKMQAVSSYILTLHGANPPNAKAPEGEKWEEPKTNK